MPCPDAEMASSDVVGSGATLGRVTEVFEPLWRVDHAAFDAPLGSETVSGRSTLPDLRSLFDRRTIKDDAMAGIVLGVESVPDGLASGLLAGVNAVATEDDPHRAAGVLQPLHH